MRSRPGTDDADTGATSVAAASTDRHRTEVHRAEVVAREKERYGGVKVGSAFFGWLTATGTAVLLTALLTAVGAAVGLATDTDPADAASQATGDAGTAGTVGTVGAIVLAVILFVSYYCGGYVAGRMARFNGAKQGVAVWLWAVVIAVVLAVLAALGAAQFGALGGLNGLPIPVDGSTLTTGGIIAAIVVAAIALAGAVLGGLAGMRFHRKVDKAGLPG